MPDCRITSPHHAQSFAPSASRGVSCFMTDDRTRRVSWRGGWARSNFLYCIKGRRSRGGAARTGARPAPVSAPLPGRRPRAAVQMLRDDEHQEHEPAGTSAATSPAAFLEYVTDARRTSPR